MEMKEITKEQLEAIMPNAKKAGRIDKYLPYLNEKAKEYHIDTQLRWAHFIAQIAHESGELLYTHELGKKAYFDKYETGKLGKMLGNTQKGDGWKFKGRGFIQLTGRANYAQYQKETGITVLETPEMLEEPEWCVDVSMWYWEKHGLNELADSNSFLTITRRINGGTNGLADRKLFLMRARTALKIKNMKI